MFKTEAYLNADNPQMETDERLSIREQIARNP